MPAKAGIQQPQYFPISLGDATSRSRDYWIIRLRG
jgi:hypothetical protein